MQDPLFHANSTLQNKSLTTINNHNANNGDSKAKKHARCYSVPRHTGDSPHFDHSQRRSPSTTSDPTKQQRPRLCQLPQPHGSICSITENNKTEPLRAGECPLQAKEEDAHEPHESWVTILSCSVSQKLIPGLAPQLWAGKKSIPHTP